MSSFVKGGPFFPKDSLPKIQHLRRSEIPNADRSRQISRAALFCGHRDGSGIAAGIAFSLPHAESRNLNLTFDLGQGFVYTPSLFEFMVKLLLQEKRLVVMEGNGIPPCYSINEDCRKDPDCPSFCSGVPCWSTSDVSCCRRNDKSRCSYCSVYLSFLYWQETGELRPARSSDLSGTKASSEGDARYEIVTSGVTGMNRAARA
ncbi:MAG: hypothetical protein GZ089_06205 [Aromatoleum sp.]|nr:hypothetical protein [Aromatoleum sp.]